MSNLTKSRRMPVEYRVRPGGITEICYSAIPQPIVREEPEPQVRLPGTRWLEVRRAREQRLAALDKKPAGKTESWADRIGNAASRPVERQAAWLLSLRGGENNAESIAETSPHASTHLFSTVARSATATR